MFIKEIVLFLAIISSFWTPNIESSSGEKSEDSIDCMECLPKCTKVFYHVSATYSDLYVEALKESNSALLYVIEPSLICSYRLFIDLFSCFLFRENLTTFNDISVVHVFYPFSSTTLFRADVVLTWQEIVSK